MLFSHHVGGKNKIKLKCQFFILVGDNLISSEDPSPIEYTESGLTSNGYVEMVTSTPWTMVIMMDHRSTAIS